MQIHVVRPGDTLFSIARQYGVEASRLLTDNQLPDPSRLTPGQALVVQFPREVYRVRQGDTLSGVAREAGLSPRALLRNNPQLRGESALLPGQELVLSYQQEKQETLSVNGYAYPFIDRGLLQRTLPYLTCLTPFTCGFTEQGDLVPLEDRGLLAPAQEMGVAALMHLSTLTREGGFSNELAHIVLNDAQVQDVLMEQLLAVLREKGYQGLDVDFEYVQARDAAAYGAFIARLRRRLSPLGLPVIAALAPKVYDEQPGLLYQGHDYRLISQAADQVLLMTYEWGYAFSEPMAVAPIRKVREVVEYALSRMAPEKIWLGVPNYGYDWRLPFRRGTRATTISNQYAVVLAGANRAAIQFDQAAQTPWFRYTDSQGQEHEVWFEDARSIRAKLSLVPEYGLYGVGYWNLMRPFPQNWLVLNALYNIRETLP